MAECFSLLDSYHFLLAKITISLLFFLQFLLYSKIFSLFFSYLFLAINLLHVLQHPLRPSLLCFLIRKYSDVAGLTSPHCLHGLVFPIATTPPDCA
jgi:hypothetical protein